ncbi:MAG: glycosyltransferase family 4 protein [Thermoflexales bacterium]|nr:glycosyltransferase family 4 protein [Thermoflexales bacterium]
MIGIDASRAASQQRTGTEAYSLHLIRALAEAAPACRFRLYFNRAPEEGLFDAHNVEPCVIPFPRLWTHLRLSAELGRRPPDALFVPAHVLPPLRPRCSLVTVHDLGYRHFPQAHPWLARLYLDGSTRWNVRAASWVLADSQATKDDAVRFYGTDPAKIVVAYPGRDESLGRVDDPAVVEKAKRRYGIEGQYILYIGTLQPRKNLGRLIEAFSASPALHAGASVSFQLHLHCAQAQVSAFSLVLAGKKGWLYDDLFEQVRRLGLDGQVIFPGFVAEEDKAALLSGAAAVAFPSLYEGFGFPALEALQCGVPLVCSNSSSLPEVAGQAALLVDPLDVDSIAQALVRIVADEDLRQDLTRRGYEQAARFSWQACARTVLDLLERTTE